MNNESKKRTNRIMVLVSDEEKKLLETKAKYYGYKTFAAYIRDSAVFEKITHVDLKGKKDIYDAYAENTKELKKFVKEIKHLNKFATQINHIDIRRITTLMFNIINKQKDMINLISEKLDYKVWEEINRKNNMMEE